MGIRIFPRPNKRIMETCYKEAGSIVDLERGWDGRAMPFERRHVRLGPGKVRLVINTSRSRIEPGPGATANRKSFKTLPDIRTVWWKRLIRSDETNHPSRQQHTRVGRWHTFIDLFRIARCVIIGLNAFKTFLSRDRWVVFGFFLLPPPLFLLLFMGGYFNVGRWRS